MLAYDLRDNAAMITADFYAGLYTRDAEGEDRGYREGMGRADFAAHFGGNVGGHLDPALAQRDVEELTSVLDASASYTNRRIAHLDRREPTRVPESAEVESWCEVLNTKLRRFTLLLQATDYRIEPVLTHDWRAIFREPWLAERGQV